MIAGLASCVLCCTVFAACTQEDATLSGIIFERGHNSAWGNQFYIALYPDEIAIARYFPEGATDEVVREHIPISSEQWSLLEETIHSLALKEKNTPWYKKLFDHFKQDGSGYRNLSLIWDTKNEAITKTYQWPQDLQANTLEALLEQLVEAS